MTDNHEHGHFEPDDETQAMVRGLVEKLDERTRKIGLYLEGVGIMSTDHPEILGGKGAEIREAIKDGSASVAVSAMFVVGEVAWAKRTLDPDQDEVDQKARELLPDPVEEMKEKIRRAKEQGKSIFDLDED